LALQGKLAQATAWACQQVASNRPWLEAY